MSWEIFQLHTQCSGIQRFGVTLQMFQYPENIGYAFGGDGSPQNVLIELYYENSQRRSGTVH